MHLLDSNKSLESEFNSIFKWNFIRTVTKSTEINNLYEVLIETQKICIGSVEVLKHLII